MSQQIAEFYAKFTADTSGLQSGLKAGKAEAAGFSNSLVQLGKSVAGPLLGIATLSGAVSGLVKITRESIDAFVNYANEVRTFSQVTGQSAEEVSRLIQFSDDYKINTGQLTTAMRFLAQEGITLSTDALAKLSDQYLALEPGTQRQTFLIEKFGRAGTSFAEIMSQGSEAIRARSAAVGESLILDEKALANARAYEMQLDDMNDALMGVKVQIGSELVPRITDGITAWQTMDETIRQTVRNAVAYGAMSSKTANVLSGIFDVITGKLGAVSKAASDRNISLGILTTAEAYEQLGISSRFATAEQRALVSAVVEASNAGHSATANYTAMAAALEQTGQQASATTTAFWGQNYALEDYSGMLSTVTDYAKMYDQASRDTEAALQAVTDAETELADLRATRPWDVKAIEAATEKVNETRAAVDELKAAQDAQATAWVNNLILQQLAQDGLTAAEMDYILQIKVKSGEMTQAAADAAQAAYDEAMKMADALAILDGKQVNIDINLITHGSQWAGGEGSGGGGAGKGSVQFAASGGYRSNAFVTGDAPGGRLTPYSELVVAPHGAMVYNASQTRAILQSGSYPAMAGGGEFVPASGAPAPATVINVSVTGNTISNELDLETVALTVAERIKRSIQQ
jgi:hypothetical protein